ncbi:cytochrome P450 [Sinobacterium caligoides]|uniref:Cytochrome P450 n=1 Tax=Sinobacterium caligoides TaxID=933926 RepID=A0A3N2DMI7_9GAMM|nr:cytochrome P450 [Sinobacterium caligoides]ROS01014.1 cytochrome P450 [Sinobacterium caligoides]
MPQIADLAYQEEPDNLNLTHIPGTFGLPLIGMTLSLVKDFYGTMDKHYKKYGPVSRIGFGGVKGLLILGPELYKQIFIDTEKNFSSRMGYNNSLGNFYGGALLLQDGDEHRYQRRIMQTAFKTPAMKGYLKVMSPQIKQTTSEWGEIKNFHFVPEIKALLLDVACQTFIGIDGKGPVADKINKAFLDVGDGLMGMIKKEIPGTKFARGKAGERYLEEFFGELVPQRRHSDGTDMLTYFSQEKDTDGNEFSDEEVRRHISFLLFAAHDTTTSALSHVMYEVGKSPEWQQRLREEVLALDKEEIEYEDLDNLPLLDNTVKEILRMHPSVMMMQRRTIRETEIGGHRVPANTVLMIAPMYSHMMPEWWDKPEEFNPDRFGDERKEHKRHSFNFMGFGGGAHKCIGMHFALMQTKVFLFHFLKQYRFRLTDGFDPKLQRIPLPKPADDLPLIIERI